MSNLRRVTPEDKNWILEVSQKAYSPYTSWVREDAAKTFDLVVNHPNYLLIRGEKTYLFAFLSRRLCDYSKFDAYMELLCGEGNAGTEPLGLLHIFRQWGFQHQCGRLTISSVTQHRFGKLIMKKLGAKPRIVYDIATT